MDTALTIRRPAPSGANGSLPVLATRKQIFLIDPHPLVREWLTHVLNKETDTIVCGEAAGAMTAMRGITTCSPHGVVMDLILDDGSGLDLIEQILFRRPRIAILVLSSHDDVYHADRALRAGAKGYISKAEPTRNIVAALRCVLQGDIYLSHAGAQCLINRRAGELAPGGARRVESLSGRELEVFEMVGRGLGTRRIGGLLHLSPKTVQGYCGRIKDKLRLCDANELMREAIRWTDGSAKRPAPAIQTGYEPDVGVIGLSERPAAA
ncbi:MAG TPA: response regulator transcription factor [Verrucomicrobiae bacterium]|nr:response regulator transcription factor [Verrucomicrobiae bacterium]